MTTDAPARREAQEKAPLDEVMLAMDVVDTLRHRERVVERELGAEDRERQLMQRLREIYESQGIEVSDEVLAQGVRALHENRFVYQPAEPGIGRTLAVLYVKRDRWGKWVGGAVVAIAAILLVYQLGIRGPQLREIEALPSQLETAHQAVVDIATEPDARAAADELAAAGGAALERRDYDAASEAVEDLGALRAQLEREYELRVVSRPGERSGIERIPEENPSVRNYYLVVEPITPDGSTVRLPIESEETGRVEEVSTWGLRVPEETYRRVAADKQDDGIIQNDVLGVKRRGELEPEYRIETTGGTITDW